jgi:hypothetical protein
MAHKSHSFFASKEEMRFLSKPNSGAFRVSSKEARWDMVQICFGSKHRIKTFYAMLALKLRSWIEE